MITRISQFSGGLRQVLRDLRYTLRSFRRTPIVATSIVVTLALAIGANAALFSLLDRLFFQAPSGVEHPSQLRRLYVRSMNVGRPIVRDVFEYLEYTQLDSVLASGARLEAYTPPDSARVGSDAGAYRRVVYATAGYFSLLGVRPTLGRFFFPAEAGPRDAASVAVIGESVWRDLFGGDPQVIGREIRIDDAPFTIIGVGPSGFTGTDLDVAEIWLPIGTYPYPPIGGQPWYRRWRSARPLRILARLRAGTSELWIASRATVARRLGGTGEPRVDTTSTVLTGPLSAALGPSTEPRQEVAIGTRLAAVVAIVLLIACANVANLLVARAMQRRREIAVRLALGISRGRLVAQLLIESLVLALIGAALGALIGVWGGGVLRNNLMPETHWAGAPFDLRVATYTALVAVTVGLLAGLAPALQSTSPDLTSSLKSSARDGASHRSRLRMVLMAAQAALSVVLLAGGGVFIESLRHVKAIDLGYDADRLVFASVEYRNPECRCVDRYFGDRNAISTGLERAAASLAVLPIVQRTALGSAGPMYGFALTRTYRASGDTIPSLEGKEAAIIDVSPEYFATTGIRLSRGRLLSPNDGPGAAPVMVVNETLARTVWPGENPIGQCLVLGAPAPLGRCYTVVGVVSDGHRFDVVEPPTMQYYVPLAQGISGHPTPARILIVRAAPGRVALVAERTRRLLRQLFPTAEPPRVTTLTARLAPQLRPWQLGAELFSAFGALSLIVAMLGIYSVVAFAAQQRRHELGVRLAVGATGRDVLVLLVGASIRVVLIGVALGVLLTLGLGRSVQAILYDTSPTDPRILAAVTLIMVGAAALASFLPGLSATRADPVAVLRAD